MRLDCPVRRHGPGVRMPLLKERLALLLILCVVVTMSGTMAAQPHQPEKPAVEQPRATHPETQPNAKGAQTQAHTTETAGEEHHEEGILPTIAKLFNFAILVGVLVYFLKSPIAAYLRSRSNDIRQDLVTAAEMRAAATAQLAEIERKLQALPAELDALKARGAEDMKAEKARIARAAGAERERLLEQTRREIDMRLRVARRELVAHAADLAVGIARERLTRSMTPDDQLRIIDRYTKQLQEAR